MKTIKYLLLSAILIGFTACNDELDVIPDDEQVVVVALDELTPGSADFSRFVSIGNSLTAGFTDNALFIAAQNNSLPNMLATRFALAGGGDFTQPLMNDNVGGFLFGGQPDPNGGFGPRLFFDGSGPAQLPGVPSTEVFGPTTGPRNNMGVPGAASFHLLFDGYGNPANLPAGLANPYYVRMASAPNATVLGDALSQAPTFVSLWIGNNDVLGYALSGASNGAPTPSDGPAGVGFDATYATILGAIQQSGAQGVVANIPYVTSIPHFTTVPHNPLDPSNPAFGPQIPTLNAAYAPLNAAFEFLGMPERMVTFSETEASPVVIHDESLQNITAQLSQVLIGGGLDPVTAGLLATQYGQSRPATESDLLVLPSSSAIATLNQDYFNFLVGAGVDPATAGQLSVNGITFPLEDKWVLVPSEQDEIRMAVDSYNATIASVASQAGFAFVDANAALQELANSGLADGDFVLTADLVTGGAFSLDGVHPTARGYAAIANLFLEAIDATYGSTFTTSGNRVDIGNFPTNYSPLLQ